MATPKDKLNKANQQKANTSSTKAPWQEALDRHVSIPASRSVEAAEVLRGFSGSWAATYELGMAAKSENDGALGSPALQKKQNHTGRPGMPEINFRPYDWGTHRFGPKGPSLLGHPVSFEVVGPTDKTILYDWQWRLTDNTATPGVGDTLQIDFDTGTGDDLSLRTPASPAAAVDTKVQTLVGGGIPTTFSDYYGFSDVTEHHGGLYMVITSGGYPVTLTNPAFEGGVGNGTIGARGTGNREGISSKNLSAYYEIFRVVDINDATKTITLDYNKRVATYFDTHSALPIVRSVMFIRPVAARLQAVPGSGQVGKETVFAVLPPERGCLDDTLPPYVFWLEVDAASDAWNPWSDNTGFQGSGVGSGDPARYFLKPQLPIDIPIHQTELVQPNSFTSAPAPVTVDKPAIVWPILSGYTGSVNDAYDSVLNIHEVEFVGNAVTYGGISWPADPGYEWMFGPHEVYRVSNAGTNVTLNRVTEYNPDTGVPFWTPLNPTSPEYVAGANDGIRMKATWHSTIRTIWTDAHPSMEKISAARLTNLIDPSWVSGSRTLKQRTLDPSVWTQGTPDRAIFDTSTSNSGAAGSNANPGSLMDLGFRMVLFPATTLGAGRLAPDFSRPIDSREVVIDRTKLDEEQWIDIDYSSGLVTLSHTPAAGGDILPNGIIGAYQSTTAEHGLLTFNTDGLGNETIFRSVGSWVTDGFAVGQKIVITNANNPANNLTCVISQVAAGTLHVNSATTNLDPFPVTLTNDAGDATAVITTGDNQRGEVVLFASFVPYTREASQYGSGVRVTAGRTGAGNGECAPDSGSQADMFSQRRYWRLSGTNAAPQVITSGENLSIVLDSVVNPTDIPSHGYIEIIQGLDPDGPPAFKDGDNYSVSTFGYFWDNNLSGGKTVLEHCWGGGRTGVAQITVNDDTPYIAVLRRDLMLPSDGRGRVGTDYKQDVTYGFANRASAIRFQHARLKRTLDGSVIIEGLEQLAESHEQLFDDLFSAWVLDGFTVTDGGGTIANVAAGTVLIDGVRSEMAATSVDLNGGDDTYYIFIEPLNGDPGCPVCSWQNGLPLTQSNHVLVGLAVVAGGVITEIVQLQNKLQDINLRDEILVGKPTSGQNVYATAHPHFEELADAVAYINEVYAYRSPEAPSTDGYGDRYIRIKVIGPTNEDPSKLPIQFNVDGVIIEGSAVRTEGDHTALGGGAFANQMSIGWHADAHLFDLNGRSRLTFRDLVFEYRDAGQAAATGLVRSVFHQDEELNTSHILIENCHLIGYNENGSGPPANIAQAFVHVTSGNHSYWRIQKCSTLTQSAAIYFGGNTSAVNCPETLLHIVIEDNLFESLWSLADGYDVASVGAVTGLRGINSNPEQEPEPFGAVILVTQLGTDHCTVRNNHIHNWAGFGIFDNGATDCLYEGNLIENTGDVGIWSGNDETLYRVANARVAGKGTRILNNTLRQVHDFPASGGIVGRRNQQEILTLAGFAGAVVFSEKRGLILSAATENTLTQGNKVSINGATATTDASIFLDATAEAVVASNHCDESCLDSTGATRGTLLGNSFAGNLILDDGTYMSVLDNGATDVEVGNFAVVDGNTFQGDWVGSGNNAVVTNNLFMKLGNPAAATVILGGESVIANNRFRAVGANAIWEVGDDSLVVGNYATNTDFTVTGEVTTFIGNVFAVFDWDAVGIDVGVTLVVGNRMTDVQCSNVAGLHDTIIANNWVVNSIILNDGVTNTQTYDRTIIKGNNLQSRIEIAGGADCVVEGNTLSQSTGYIALGDSGLTSVVTNSLVAGNVVRGSQALVATVPNTGIGGINTYDPSLFLDDNCSGNIIYGNQFTGGLYAGTGTTETLVHGNAFHDTNADNCSILLAGANSIFSNNRVNCQFFVAEDVALVLNGNGTLAQGNYFTLGQIYINADNIKVQNNQVTNDPARIALTTTATAQSPVITGNHIVSDATLNAATTDAIFSSNFVEGGALVAGANSVVSGNKVGTNLSVSGNNSVATGNSVAGAIDIGGDGTVASGNWSNTFNVPDSSADQVVAANYVDAGMTVYGDGMVVSANRVGSNLNLYGFVDGTVGNDNESNFYVASNNRVTGYLYTAGAVTGTGTGVLVGNVVERIHGNNNAATEAIPATGMVVLGNKSTSGGAASYIYTVDPGNTSVGAAAANQLSDFNVTET